MRTPTPTLTHTLPPPQHAQAGAFRVLLELTAVAPDAVGARVGELAGGLGAALRDRTSAGGGMKIQALQFLGSGERRVLCVRVTSWWGCSRLPPPIHPPPPHPPLPHPVMAANEPVGLQPLALQLAPAVCAAAGERYYKVRGRGVV